MADVQPFPHHTQGANMPRWKRGDERFYADRINTDDGQFLFLESGTRVKMTDDLLKTGPARIGDFYTFNSETGAEKLVAGADFQTTAVPIPHALDVTAVSADAQPGFKPGEPEAGSPDDPMAEKTPVMPSDPIAASDEHHAAEGEKPTAGG